MPLYAARARAGLFDEADERLVAHRLDVLAVLEHRAERLLDDLGVDLLAAERARAPAPSRSSPRRRAASRDRGRAARGRTRPPPSASRSGIPGTRSSTISTSRSIDGCPIQWKSARRFSASCSSRVRFEVRITAGLRRARIVPSSGIVIWKSESTSSRNASNSSSARSISSISSTTGSSGVDRLEQRPADEELRAEELLLRDGALLRGADVQQLARVVPLVDGVRDVEALVALEPDQPRVESAVASAFAASVFPTPASPSSSSGFSSASPRKSAVASPRSGR